MRHLLIAAALGLGLLSAGGLSGTASASPYGHAADERPAATDGMITPVHYERGYHWHHRPYHAPPPHRHWHRYEPPRYHHPPRHGQPYGWRR